ncbi:hypothetical protein A9975_11075 [Cupriavidus sp. UME77]|nr:hypothetical protein [Cupriavidus sp. UME77]
MLAMCLSNSVAFACSPRVKGVDLQFPKNVHTLNASVALKLGTWLADLRVHYPNYDYFFIAAYLVGGDTGGRRLVSARAETVRHFLVSRGFNPTRIHTSARATFLDDPAMGESGRAVGVDFLPACPHACCDMPTHRVKFTGLPMPEDTGIAHQ